MKINWLNKTIFGMFAATAVIFASCSDTNVAEETGNPEGPTEEAVGGGSNLTTVQLASFASSQDRVTPALQSRADEDSPLELLYEIENLSKQEGEIKITGFEKEENGRYLSATCVYYDQASEKYYVTYHMQGNNYNTQQTNETGGFIETFTLDKNTKKPIVDKVYMAADPTALSFDFNHLYFDELNGDYLEYKGNDAGSKRIIAVGHKSEPSSKEGGKPNTAAIIAKLNLEEESPSITFDVVYTGEKILDVNGNSLGKEDAGDVNCVLRKSNYYYLATRKGIAVLNAKDDNLFTPIHDYIAIGTNENGKPKYGIDENSTYFIKTPGSAKHLAHRDKNSHFSLLYLSESYPKDITSSTESPANIINFSMETGGGTLCGSNTSDSSTDGPGILNSKELEDITKWSPNVNQSTISQANVCPVDGKNVLSVDANGNFIAACLGKGGLFIKDSEFGHNTVKTFSDKKEGGSRPVNGVVVENYENVDGSRSNDGFIYVANGACLTILDANTLNTICEYSAFDSKSEENLASANYVHVVKADTKTNGKTNDRIITVAFGQAGVKVFKFIPPVK